MKQTSSLISICMPVWNARPFLPARFDSIFSQTHENWELVVVDGHSDDGSWEYLRERTNEDTRVRLSQAPRDGIYSAINTAIGQAKGSWIYFATADDTMAPSCLDVLLSLAEGGGGTPCIAQCGLTLIDEFGEPLTESQQWPQNTEWNAVWGKMFTHRHERKAPFDGAAVMLFSTVITSLTQGLFPREAFQRLGGFPNHLGSAGDMAWEGLAGFFYDVRFTPERLATWRVHPAQATSCPRVGEDDWTDRRLKIGNWILDRLRDFSGPLYRKAKAVDLGGYNRFWRVRRQTVESPGQSHRLVALQRMIAQCPRFYAQYLRVKLLRGAIRSKCDPVTSARTHVAERFLGYPVRNLSPAVM